MSELEPTITFGNLTQSLHLYGQYLLWKAELSNGTYAKDDFIQKLKDLDLSKLITVPECLRDLNAHRQVFLVFTRFGATVTIKDFEPNTEQLERFVNITMQQLLSSYKKD